MYDCDIVLRKTKIKGKQITENYIKNLMEKLSVSDRPLTKVFKLFIEEELDAFWKTLFISNVYRFNKECIPEMWKLDSLSIIRAVIPQFKILLMFINFDNVTRYNIMYDRIP